MKNKFIHFRTQSSYSMLESTIKIDQLVDLTKHNNMEAICLSDRGNLFASLEFAIAATKSRVQPIHGSILNILFSNKGIEDYAEILLIAKNKQGYQNLLNLVSLTFTQNDQTICNHITFSDLQKYSEGIIALSAYTEGVVGKLLLNANKETATNAAKKLKDLFSDRFYFEIMRHNIAKEQRIESDYLNIANSLNIPIIATNQTLFGDISMHDAHDILLCISEGVVQQTQERKRVSNQCYFKSPAAMIELFSDLPEAIENTICLAQRCYIMSETRPPSLPNFSDDSISEEELIRKQAQIGLEKKLLQKFKQENTTLSEQQSITEQYQQRKEYELDIICNMGFSGYFLIVFDFIKWSKENDIAVGPGRGSGAGSIIAWILQITDLDPIKFGLLFERFLNPERVSMPDFDIDFCQERREEVISYVRSKYGDERVGQIITFGKMQAKAVIKDVSRVLGLSYTAADQLTELVPFNAINPVNLGQAINEVAELKGAAKGQGLYNYDGDEKLISQVLSIALKLEGLQRHTSTHAAGVLIANQDLTEIVPVYKDNNSDMLIVQYSMKYAEAAGLVKFDFLGLQTLTIITKAVKLINKTGVIIDIDSIPYGDTKTYKMLSAGLGTGVFQFESLGMKNSLRKLRPDNLDDIIALGALYRPGPMENIPTYIACKHKKQEVDYLHPLLESTLKPTYGVIIYQEQVMEIAQILSGYSLGSADLLRRAMGKKVKAEMDAQEELFIQGAIENNVSATQAKDIFKTVAKFAGYGFNKSHATAYAVISYQTAYLKANFPAEFLVACLNLEMDNSDKISISLEEAKIFNISIIAPDINLSKGPFAIDIINNKKSIIFAIGSIKNVTINFGNAVEQERQKNGDFKSIINFVERINPQLINKRLLENIIKAGCFDKLHKNRSALVASVPNIMAYCATYHQEQNSDQFSLLSVQTNTGNIILNIKNYSSKELAFAEFEVTGLFLQNHPLDELQESLIKRSIKTSSYIKNNIGEGSSRIKLAGIITKKTTRMSLRGRFITLSLSDTDGIFEVTIFNEDLLRNYANLIIVKKIVIIDCNIFKDKGGTRITALKFTDIEEEIAQIQYNLELYPQNTEKINKIVNLLKHKINPNKHNSFIKILLPIEGGFSAQVKIPEKFWLNEEDVKYLSQ